MGADLTRPFAESCCEAGGEPGSKSAMSCGCDEGANWICKEHQAEGVSGWDKVNAVIATSPLRAYSTSLVVEMPDGKLCDLKLSLTPIGSSSTSLDLYWTQRRSSLEKLVLDMGKALERVSSRSNRVKGQKK